MSLAYENHKMGPHKTCEDIMIFLLKENLKTDACNLTPKIFQYLLHRQSNCLHHKFLLDQEYLHPISKVPAFSEIEN